MTLPPGPISRTSLQPGDWLYRALVLAVLAGSLYLGASRLTRGHDWGDDFAAYIMQARSVWNGDTRGFVERSSFTILQSSRRIGPVTYPWGFPLILAPVYGAAGLDLRALKLPGMLLFAGFLLALHALMRQRLDRAESLLVLSLFAFHPYLLDFLDLLLSDIPFLFLSTLSLLLVEGVFSGGSAGVVRGAVAGAVIFAAVFTRTVGLLLLGSLLALQAWEAWKARNAPGRTWPAAYPAAVATLVFGLLWLGSALAFPDEQMSYLAQLGATHLSRIWSNGILYFGDAAVFFTGSRSHPGVVVVLLLAGAAGLVRRAREDLLLVVYLAASIAVLVTWPEYQGPRFLFPILPLLAYFIVVGLRYALSLLPARARTPALVAVLASWLALIGIDPARARPGPGEGAAQGGPFDAQSTEMFRFVQEETPPGSVIVFFKPRAMRLMTGRQALMSMDCAHLKLGDYVVLRKKDPGFDQLTPDGLRSCGAAQEPLFENGAFVAFGLRR